MSRHAKLRVYFSCSVATAVLGAVALAPVEAVAAPCGGPAGSPAPTETQCVTAIAIPGNPLRSFDISFVSQERPEFYLADRSNSAIDVINTKTLKVETQLTGFIGIVLNGSGAVDNNHSGPDGVASHGRWVYAGDGNSTLKVFDLNTPITGTPLKQTISTGGSTRLDEMALTSDGKLIIAANNAEDPPFGTLFNANGDAAVSNVTKIAKIVADPTIIPSGFGLSIEQPAWDPTTARFYTSIPIIANNPSGCNYGQVSGAITCHGGLMVLDPTNLGPLVGGTATVGAYNAGTNTGVFPLPNCGPNGATVADGDNLMLGCTPGNQLPAGNPAADTTTLVINAKTKNSASVNGITGSDEVWFDHHLKRYYLGASKAAQGPVLGVVDESSILVETIPQSSGSHSVASNGKYIFVPQVAPKSVVGTGGDTTGGGAGGSNSALICGTLNGCIAVYQKVE
jgi:hypothetical protein